MRLLFTRHLLIGMNEKCARYNFDLLNFESFSSKRPIELINVQVSVILRIWNDIPKRPNSFYWAKRKTTICVRNGLMLLWNFFLHVSFSYLVLTCLTFGKRDWKTANHFPSFDSFMSAILFHI